MKQNNNSTNSSLEYTDKILNENNVTDYEILYTIDYNVDQNEVNDPSIASFATSPIDMPNFPDDNSALPSIDIPSPEFLPVDFPHADIPPVLYPELPQTFFTNNNLPQNNLEPNIDSLIYEKFKPLDSLYLSKKKVREMCQEKKLILSDVEINNIYRYFYEKKLNELDLNSYLNKLYIDNMNAKSISQTNIDKADKTKDDNKVKDDNKAKIDKAKVDKIQNNDKAINTKENDVKNYSQIKYMDRPFDVKDKFNNNSYMPIAQTPMMAPTPPPIAPQAAAPMAPPPPIMTPLAPHPQVYSNYDQNFDYGRIRDIFKLTLLEEEQKKYHLDAQLEKIKSHIDKRLSVTESIFNSNNHPPDNLYARHFKPNEQLRQFETNNQFVQPNDQWRQFESNNQFVQPNDQSRQFESNNQFVQPNDQSRQFESNNQFIRPNDQLRQFEAINQFVQPNDQSRQFEASNQFVQPNDQSRQFDEAKNQFVQSNNQSRQFEANNQIVATQHKSDLTSPLVTNFSLKEESNTLENNEIIIPDKDKQNISNIDNIDVEEAKLQIINSNDTTLKNINPMDLYSKDFHELNEKHDSYTSSDSLKINLMQSANNSNTKSNPQFVNSNKQNDFNDALILNSDERQSDVNKNEIDNKKTYDWRQDRNNKRFGLNDLESSVNFLNDGNNALSSQLASDEDYLDEKLSRSLDDIALIKEIIKDNVDPNLERDLETSIELFENVRK